MNTKNSLFFLGLIFSILLIPTSSQLSFAEKGTILVHSYDVAYNIENGIVESMYLDPDFIELVITMNTSSDGTFEITIPRTLLDAKFETSDDIFFVLVDGFETDYLEIETSSESRTLVIPFFVGDSIIDIIGTTALNPFIEEPEIEIPSWIKSNAEWWASNQIDDETFVQGIQYLITNGIMNIPETKSGESSGKKIPSWIKSNAEWWASNQIDDETFVQGIQYLITNG
ncbi:MAG: hypothetical protein HKP31_06365, partial [Nitrosopumilus sp.]|nr:hypothetical protein [Nitrosopumilus sp.]